MAEPTMEDIEKAKEICFDKNGDCLLPYERYRAIAQALCDQRVKERELDIEIAHNCYRPTFKGGSFNQGVDAVKKALKERNNE